MHPQWQDLLTRQGLAADGETFGDLAAELSAARGGTVVVPLLDQGLIRASGPDAAEFLHNLMTNDVKNLAANGLRFAGFCTAKGRLLATCHIWKPAEDVVLMALAADIQPAILKKLSMFVLRSKVKLTDAGEDTVLLGLAGPGAVALVEELSGQVPEPRHQVACAGGQVLRLDDHRFVLALAPAAAIQAWPMITAGARPAGSAAWRWLEIAAGQPRVVAATQEAFVPQMVNMEVPEVAGVVFTKGCYPGQEIVARTQYLGKVKRRMYRARLDQPLPPGTDVFTPEAGDQHCGALVTVAPSPEGGWECLVVVQSSGAEAGEVHLGSPTGPRLTLMPLPYVVG
jgi:folate-binding protein YgfZ